MEHDGAACAEGSGGGVTNAGEMGEAELRIRDEARGCDRIVTGRDGQGPAQSTIGRSISRLGQIQQFKV